MWIWISLLADRIIGVGQGWYSSYPAIHFDHILINNNLLDEFGNNSTVNTIKIENYFENGSSEYDENVSDHRPVYFKFTP